MLQTILLVILIFVCVALVAVILLQKSEGGALGMGGGSGGFMSTRGVGDLLTRTTGILAAAFFILCLTLTLVIGRAHKGDAVVDRLKIQGIDPASLATKPAAPAAPAANNTTGPAPNAPLLLDAPKPEVHTAPSTATPLLSAPPAAVVKKPAAAAPAKATATPAPAAAAPAAPAPATTAPANTAAPK